MTPYQRASDGRWVIALTAGPVDGVRKRRYATGKTPAAARRRAHKLIGEMEAGVPAKPAARKTLREVEELWLDAIKRSIAPSTYVSYERHCRHTKPLHAIPVADLTFARISKHLDELAARRELSGRTVAYHLSVIRMALKWAERAGLVATNQALLVAPPKQVPTERVPFRREDAQKIVAALEAAGEEPADRWVGLWAVLFGTGCRIGEALGIRRGDWCEGVLTIQQQIRLVPPQARAGGRALEQAPTKTRAGARNVIPAEFAARVLDRLANAVEEPSALLFHVRGGGPINPRNANRSLERVERALGIATVLPPHSARHTVASEVLAEGTIDDLKRFIGHSTLSLSSDQYGHWDRGRGREIGNVLDRRLGPGHRYPAAGALGVPEDAENPDDEGGRDEGGPGEGTDPGA